MQSIKSGIKDMLATISNIFSGIGSNVVPAPPATQAKVGASFSDCSKIAERPQTTEGSPSPRANITNPSEANRAMNDLASRMDSQNESRSSVSVGGGGTIKGNLSVATPTETADLSRDSINSDDDDYVSADGSGFRDTNSLSIDTGDLSRASMDSPVVVDSGISTPRDVSVPSELQEVAIQQTEHPSQKEVFANGFNPSSIANVVVSAKVETFLAPKLN